MIEPSCRKRLTEELLHEKKRGSNASLLMARFLEAASKGDDGSKREELYDKIIEAVRSGALYDLYKTAFNKRTKILDKNDFTRPVSFKVGPGGLIVGLGGASVLETGLTLNPLYGVPMIPASSIKGVVAHYCHSVYGKIDERFREGNEYYKALFGTDSAEKKQLAGAISFYDAWLSPKSLKGNGCLVKDVMTPHHSEYYSTSGKQAPTVFDSPNPVMFLSVPADCEFEFRLRCESDDSPNGKDTAAEWLDFVVDLLKNALLYNGIGGKLSSGYGQMIFKEKDLSDLSPNEQRTAKGLLNIGDPIRVRLKGVNKKGNGSFESPGHEKDWNISKASGRKFSKEEKGQIFDAFVSKAPDVNQSLPYDYEIEFRDQQ